MSDLEQVSAEEDLQKYVAFRLGDEMYGLPIGRIKEILNSWRVTRVPRGPAHLMGVANVRGQIVGVVDLRVRLGMPYAERDEDARLVLTSIQVEKDEVLVGLVVDEVKDIVSFSQSNVEPAENFASKADLSMLEGGLTINDKALFVLKLEAVI